MVERVLDVNDDAVDISSINWRDAMFPPDNTTSSNNEGSLEATKINAQREEPSSVYLHSASCFLTVKWESLPYAYATFESVEDLRIRGIEYESQLRDFYKREQMSPPEMKPPGIDARNVVHDSQVSQ